ncbi:DUF2637 domain-containing protein [Streptomyces lavendofoliae]|uniref:DUF2637 domain-containing protein n=1 Tax=Streptomyces lavendofoliae TaxID=67314 RepID=A0A918I2N8_9ACTN|nr:DUF2637 domain-containing protein [Streptomyces lavendofoliae]GGU62609.1 hypothetical protein GCM10010274_59260 [Streptomyces lavendofoliae]
MNTTPAGLEPHTPAAGEQPRTDGATPHTRVSDRPNPLYDPLVTKPVDAKAWVIRIVLGLVMSAALGVGTWSIYTLLTEVFGTPEAVAVLGCGLFDVSAIFFALLGQSYATTTDSGLAPRLAMLTMVCTSSWVNWKHAQLENWGTVGGVIFASAPIIAELAFEMWHRFEHRATLRALGRVAQTLPVLGKWAWIAHPIRSRKTIDAHIRAALTEHEAVAQLREETATERAATILGGATVTVERVPATAPQSAPNRIPLPVTGRPVLDSRGAWERPAVAGVTNAPATERRGVEERGVTPTLQSARAERGGGATADATTGATEAYSESVPADATPAAQSAPRHATNSSAVAPTAKKPDATEATGRQAAKDAILSLYRRNGRRPLESEMVTELKRIRAKHTSRQYAGKLRAELETENPSLAALGTENVRVLTGTDG